MTKRQLGILLIFLGIGGALSLLLIDLLGASQFQGIGPTQRLALLAAVLLNLVGVSLLPLGDRPA